jgi:restriction system protein
MITSESPSDWSALQVMCAQVLSECGFAVEVEKSVALARGQAVIDVVADEMVDGRRYRVLCECKHWRSRVPQTVVHAFRTVVADSGANVGYLIASGGFQSGAETAASLSNVQLVTWDEFQSHFEATWVKRYLRPTVTTRCDPLMELVEPLPPRWCTELKGKQREKYMELRKKYEHFGWLMMTFTRYMREIVDGVPALPLRGRSPELDEPGVVPAAMLDSAGYREFLQAAFAFNDRGLAEFEALRPPSGAV